MIMNSKFKGYTYGCISSMSYGLIPLFTIPMMNSGMRIDSILFYRYLMAVIGLAVLMIVKKESFRIQKADIPMLLVMGLLFGVSSFTLFESYNYLSAGIASTILFVYPVFVTIIMALVFKEKVSILTITAIILAFTGISILYKDDSGATLSMTGIVWIICSALTYALYIVGVNKSRIHTMSGLKLTFYSILIGSLFFWVKLQFGFAVQPMAKPELWLNAAALGLFPTVVSCMAMVSAVHYVGSTPTAVLGAMEPVTAVAISAIAFAEPLTFRIISGVLLIIAAVTLIILGDQLIKPLYHALKLLPIHNHLRK